MSMLTDIDARPEVPLAAEQRPAVRASLGRQRWLQLSAGIIALVLLVGAVAALRGGTREGTATSAVGGAAGAPEFGRAAPPAAAAGDAVRAPLAGPAPASQPQQKAATAAGSSDGAASRIVKTGSLALVAKRRQVSAVVTAVSRAAALEDGYLAASATEELGANPSAELTVRVPVGNFEDLVARIRGLGAEVRSASMSGRDVTAQYADLEAQLRTLRAARDRFLVILSRTKTIPEILTVQQRVDDVTGQIDRIEGGRKLLASQSDLSTLTVSVTEAGSPVIEPPGNGGLGAALRDAKDGFVTGVEAIVRHSGRAVLFLLCLAVALLVGRLGWKVARRRLV